MSRIRFYGWKVLLILVLNFVSLLHAQEEPSGEDILQKYVNAAGGINAFDDIKNRTTNSFVKLMEANRTLNLIIKEAKPSKSYSRMGAIAGGILEKGCDGITAWQKDSEGVRSLRGMEKWNLIRNSAFDKYIYWQKNFSKIKYISQVELQGKKAHKVALTPVKLSSGDIVYDELLYFDVNTGLLIQNEIKIPSGGGVETVVTTLGDYRPVGNVKLPFFAKVASRGQTREIKILKVTHNTPVSSTTFRKPLR